MDVYRIQPEPPPSSTCSPWLLEGPGEWGQTGRDGDHHGGPDPRGEGTCQAGTQNWSRLVVAGPDPSPDCGEVQVLPLTALSGQYLGLTNSTSRGSKCVLIPAKSPKETGIGSWDILGSGLLIQIKITIASNNLAAKFADF